ncbi:hypothetical protein KR018_003075 [Drosophila ironensis]|nr:hypothetical protein KR018_003075 [Drosophila ironensis]
MERSSQVDNEQRKKEEYQKKCDSDFELQRMLDNLPRYRDTFWCTDASLPRSRMNGLRLLRSGPTNKGLAFSLVERRIFSIHGLLPFATRDIEKQVEVCQKTIELLNSSTLQVQMYMNRLVLANTRLYYRLLLSDPFKYMPMVEAAASEHFIRQHSFTFTTSQGVFVTVKDLGHVHQILANWPVRNVRCVLVSNGESFLSYGDLGVDAMPMIFSKMHDLVVFGGMPPHNCLCVMLDVGCNNEGLLEDRFYTGLPQRRAPKEECDKLFDELMICILSQYGSRAMILTRDFAVNTAMRRLEKFRNRCCILDTLMHGMATSALAALIASNRKNRTPFSQNVFVFFGTEAVNMGFARLIVAFLKREGDPLAHERIHFCDESGYIVHSRDNIPEEVLGFVQEGDHVASLLELIEKVKPNVLVGASLISKSFTPDVLRAMERSSQCPIIYCLSRPRGRAECTAEDAFSYTKGRCIFISGSRLPPLKYANKMYQPPYCSSKYVLAGATVGITLAGFTHVPDETFCVVAERMASLVWPRDLEMRNVLPPLRKLQCISLKVADAVFTYAYRKGLATRWPQPENSMEYIKKVLYDDEYRDYMYNVYCMQERRIATMESHKYYQLGI